MGICAVQSKPHVATLPRPSLIRMNLSSVIGKSNDHQLISPVGLEQIEWRDEVEKKDIAPSSITFGNAATKPTNKAFVPSYTGTIVLDENGYQLCYNVIAFSFIAVQLFECMSTAYSEAFEHPKPSADSPRQNGGTDVDVNRQVSSCAGYDPHVYGGHKRQSTGGGGGGSEPKKHRSNNQGDGNYNNAPPGDNGASSGSGHGGHGNNGGGSNQNNDTQNSNVSTEKRFACPFHKLDPVLHAACEPIKLTTWDRVLQHILRAHVLQKHYCPNCRTQFKGSTAESEKNKHIRSGCQFVGMMEAGYIFLQIDPANLCFETDYENLKGLPRGSDEEKWFKAWDKLFPGVPRPASPLFESIVDILRRNARRALAGVPEPLRSMFNNAIFDLPTVASRLASRDLAPPNSAPTSTPAAMATPTMTPQAPALSPGQIAAQAQAPAPPSAPTSRRPQVPPGMRANSVAGQGINNPTMQRRMQAQARMNLSSVPYGFNPTAGGALPAQAQTNPQVRQGQPSSGWRMNAPARPHPPAQARMSPSAGHGPHGATGRSIPALPDQVLLYPQSPVGQSSIDQSSIGQQNPIAQQNPVAQQNPAAQQNSLDELNNLDPLLQVWDGSMQDMLNNPVWDLGNENIFANPGMGLDSGVDKDEDDDELNHPSALGNGSGFGYPDPGSGYMD
ncbi:hypothetical protein NCS57_00173400 [Fusarium keratoplasticum]|uniref:Uncharacterized protein n=1 Tax=Fusarium keratoplasticum TaxID=1328300 RepID=A0ACC0RIF9_9HYPO|nr:hypothetical protein NCS57_00173400 [Fusarium keratoplasticum]KAI8685054.1 hypothetical protein NCS57_00173400 [Fusarium keratoplasticum]